MKNIETASPVNTENRREPVTSGLPEAGPRLRWLRRSLPLVFLIFIAVFAAKALRGLDIHALRSVLQTLSLPKFVMIQLTAITGLLITCLYDFGAARILQIRIAARTLLRTAWIANTFNNLIGISGFAGSGIRMLLLAREGIETRKTAAFAAMIMVSVPVGLAVLSWPLLLFGGVPADRLAIPVWILWLAIAVFASYLPVYIVLLSSGMISRLLRDLEPQRAIALIGIIIVSTLDWLLAAAVAWLALTFSGAAIPWAPFLFAFLLASMLGILSLIPGGLGVFDTALVVLLTPFAQATEPLVSAVLLYRLCYYLVPWFIAVYLGANQLMLPKHWQQSSLVQQWRESKLPTWLRLPLNILASLGVRVLAYLSFGAGVVLLASAAFPTLGNRLAVLHSIVPLAAIEISHLLSVAVGVLLIALSRGIAEQVRSAYVLTQILLIAGACLSFLKGIDYEEAMMLLLAALLLKRQRSHFYRESYPLLSPRSLLWLVGLIVSVVGFAWLGDWVHGDIPLGWDHLSHFAPALETSRFARGLLMAMAVATGFIGWSFYQRPRTALVKPDTASLAQAKRVLDQYGGSEFAHLLFLGDKSLIWSPDRTAFMQYSVIRDRLIALGDPCGNPDAFDATLIAFRDFADRLGMTPCCYEISETRMHHYHDAGFALFKLGETAVVNLSTFTTAGKRGEALRHSVNRATRGGAEFELLEQPVDEVLWPQLRALSDAWLSQRGAAEKGFSLGNYKESYLRLSPIAIIRVNGEMVAFANLMPDYGGHSELSVDLMRYHPQAPSGTMDFLFVEMIRYAQAQGYRYFNLGMTPLGGVGETRYARVGEKVAHLAYEYGNRFYNYKGLRSFKEKFHPEWRSAYLAYPFLTPLPILLMDSAALIAGGYRRIFFKSE